MLGWVICLVLLVLFFGLFWVAIRMSHHMTIAGKTFRCGAREGLQDARLHLAFLALVGHWFVPEKDICKFEQNDEDATSPPSLKLQRTGG